ncbi:hypothetical protein R1sor_005975 [Riccia sorocarpa]|uniref:Uncharacterized protein n=1 Tax=Riccia sorocarpa TaxID=122646 RepID=A0ABD3HPS7_9MARC
MPRPPVQPWVPLPGHKNLDGRARHTPTLVRQKTYVLGGRNGNQLFNDLWVFDTECFQLDLLTETCTFGSQGLP